MPTQRQEDTPSALLLHSIYEGQAVMVAAVLARGADPNIPQEGGIYPLALATFRGRLDMVRLLLDHGAKVDSRDPEGNIPLHTACTEGHASIVRELLAAGANSNERDMTGRVSLHWMAREGSTEIIKDLIRAGAKVDARDCEGYAPVHYAADMGHLPVLRELMRAGSSHAWRQNGFQTPLALACFNGHFACVKYLLDECKADPREGGNVRSTPLAISAHRGHLEMVKMLLRFGVRQLGPYAYNDALCGVAMNGNVRVMRELLSAEGGVHVKGVKTSDDRTLLHYSAGHCHPLVTSMLLEAGGDEKVVEATGKTPFDIVDTLSHEHVRNGLEQRRVRRMLTQAPAYRARSWKWPNKSVALVPSPTAKPAKHAADSAAGKAGAGSAEGATEPAEMTAEDLDRAFDVAMAITTASAGTGKVAVTVFRRQPISSSRSAADGHSAVVASMIRYSRKK